MFSPTAAGIFSGKVTQDSINIPGSRWDANVHLSPNPLYPLPFSSIFSHLFAKIPLLTLSRIDQSWRRLQGGIPQTQSPLLGRSRLFSSASGASGRARRRLALGHLPLDPGWRTWRCGGAGGIELGAVREQYESDRGRPIGGGDGGAYCGGVGEREGKCGGVLLVE